MHEMLVPPHYVWYLLNKRSSSWRSAFNICPPFVVSYAQSGQMVPCALRPAGAEAVFAISPSA